MNNLASDSLRLFRKEFVGEDLGRTPPFLADTQKKSASLAGLPLFLERNPGPVCLDLAVGRLTVQQQDCGQAL